MIIVVRNIFLGGDVRNQIFDSNGALKTSV